LLFNSTIYLQYLLTNYLIKKLNQSKRPVSVRIISKMYDLIGMSRFEKGASHSRWMKTALGGCNPVEYDCSNMIIYIYIYVRLFIYTSLQYPNLFLCHQGQFPPPRPIVGEMPPIYSDERPPGAGGYTGVPPPLPSRPPNAGQSGAHERYPLNPAMSMLDDEDDNTPVRPTC